MDLLVNFEIKELAAIYFLIYLNNQKFGRDLCLNNDKTNKKV